MFLRHSRLSPALTYDLVGNIGWFLGMIFSVILLIALVVVFFLCYKRGFRLGDEKQQPYAPPYSGTYDSKLVVNLYPLSLSHSPRLLRHTDHSLINAHFSPLDVESSNVATEFNNLNNKMLF